MKDIVLLGGGGFAIELLDYMLQEDIKPIGYYSLEKNDDLSKHIKWLGNEKTNYSREYRYIIASGRIDIRKKMIDFLEKNKLDVGSFISKKAYISNFAVIGKGAVIVPMTMITGNPIIGDYLFLNIKGTISHHVKMKNNIVVGPGCKITGHCQIGNNVIFGANSCLIPDTKIEDNSEIGINSFPRQIVKSNKIVVSRPGEAIDRAILKK